MRFSWLVVGVLSITIWWSYFCNSFSIPKSRIRYLNQLLMSDGQVSSDQLPEDAIGRPPSVLPRASSKTNFGKVKLNIKYDTWLVGSGTLGELILANMPQPKGLVIAETKSARRHEQIKSLGAIPRLRDDRTDSDIGSAKTVIICLPPSCSEEHYTEEIHAAAALWAGIEGGGNLVYTSSIAVYGPSLGNIVNEDFRVDSRSSASTK